MTCISHTAIQIIPKLNRRFLHNKATASPQIVRYVGMVQDMLEPEYYLSYIEGVTTHFRDYNPTSIVEDFDVAHKLAERQPLVVVPLPFGGIFRETPENEDPAMREDSSILVHSDRSNKRTIDQVSEEQHGIRRAPVPTNIPSPVSARDVATVMQSTHGLKRNDGLKPNDWWPPGTLRSNPDDCPVLAKLYYEQTNTEDRRLKLNQIVELIGILSMDPLDADFDNNDDPFGLDRLVVPPPSLLPRLHVLCVNQLDLEETAADLAVIAEDEKSRVLQLLTDLVGSETTAEALLMVLLSMAERKPDAQGTFIPVTTLSDTTLGCASLNLILPDEAACCTMQETLQGIFQQFLPMVGSCSLADLGCTLVSPAQSDAGRLTPSPLQLPKGATILINESTLQAGQIGPRSQETLAALSSLSRSHIVPYRFDGMMAYQWEADYRIIVLSVSKRSAGSKLMPCVMQRAVNEPVPNSAPMLSEETKNALCSYLTKARKTSSPTHKVVLDSVVEEAQREFIQRRVQARTSGTEECVEQDLHRWLTMTTLQARSRGGTSATLDDWKAALRLDDAMLS
jgi:hypothetical protein